MNPKIKVLKNSTALSGAMAASHYIKNGGGHAKSSATVVYFLRSVLAGDVISVTVEQEANVVTCTTNEDKQLLLIAK